MKFYEKRGERWECYDERQGDDQDREAVRAREWNWKQERSGRERREDAAEEERIGKLKKKEELAEE